MTDSPGLRDRAFVGLQHLLPQHLLSRGMRELTRVELAPFKDLLISGFLKLYDIDMNEAEHPDPHSYASFNAFFTRALRAGARPLDASPQALVSPVDGQVSQAGPLDGETLVQAKGLSYTATDLLGGDAALASEFAGGSFATIYLAPFNYHRIHMPVTGTLRTAVYAPGDLFSVNAVTAANVPRLFARNERVACVFDTPAGPVALVLVGALFVGSMSLVWAGEVTTRRPARNTVLPLPSPAPELARGAEMGRFNMGSTVVMLFPRDRMRVDAQLSPGRVVRMGERIGECLETRPA
ncbi:MAG: phosphatidylserine decarboxylase [Gammaproteobacteria bacterium]|nr:phosphatidylserine decarboxylase [Gammaproteobacteria bacterium]